MRSSMNLPWVRKINSALEELDQIPLFGHAPSFDLAKISSLVASCFNAADFSASIGEAKWRTAQGITEGLGPHQLMLGIVLSPLGKDALWLMSRRDVAHLTSRLLHAKGTIRSEILQEGFYRYLVLSVLDGLQEQEPLKPFTLQLDEEARLRSEHAYCIDVRLSLGQSSCWGRLVLGSELLSAFRAHFSSMREVFSPSSFAKNLEVTVGLRTGTILLSQKEWKSVKKGDWLALDRGGYDARHKEGMASLTLGATPLFHVHIKENKIKLIETALFYEENMEMNRETNSQEMKGEQPIPPEEGRSMAIKELPLFITVELARLRMTVDHLMNLSPGNFLELPIHPDQGIALTVNGQKIGRGELVYLGEKLGIRVLETAE